MIFGCGGVVRLIAYRTGQASSYRKSGSKLQQSKRGGLRRKSVDLPFIGISGFFCVEHSVVEAPWAALPELEALRNDSEATPEFWEVEPRREQIAFLTRRVWLLETHG